MLLVNAHIIIILISISLGPDRGSRPIAHGMDEGICSRLYGAAHFLVHDLARFACETKDLLEAVGMEACFERHERHFARSWHDCSRQVRDVHFLKEGHVEQWLRRVHAGRHSTDKIKERNAGGHECERRGVDGCAEQAAVLLQDLDENVNLGTRVEMCLDDGLECRLDRSRKLQDTPV